MPSPLPPDLTADAVPVKRTAEERCQPSVEEQAEANSSESPNNGEPSCDQAGGIENTAPTNGKTRWQTESEPRKKSKDKKGREKKTVTIKNVTSISQCKGFQIGNNYYATNNFNINGGPSTSDMFKEHFSSNSSNGSPPGILKKVLHCFDTVSEDDCTHVSEYISCNWKVLGEKLFAKQMQMNKMKERIASIEEKPKKEAVRLILIRWRQDIGKSANVSLLCSILQQLSEFKAIEKLAIRHGIE